MEHQNDSLQCMAQGDNYLTSSIPASWLRAGSFPRLSSLSLALNQLMGAIPAPEPDCGLCAYKVGAFISHQIDRPHAKALVCGTWLTEHMFVEC